MNNSAMIGRLIALLFLGREVAHREHLRTKSFSQHTALGTFYDEVIGIADSIAEAYQGRNGIIENIPMLNNEAAGPIDMVLEKQLDAIEKLRYTAVDRDDTAIQNLIDEAVALYLSTLYKLRNLK
jgi:midasin (ATPase involved in ribosome maturation)